MVGRTVGDVGSAAERELAGAGEDQGIVEALKQKRRAARGSHLEQILTRLHRARPELQLGGSDRGAFATRLADRHRAANANQALPPKPRPRAAGAEPLPSKPPARDERPRQRGPE